MPDLSSALRAAAEERGWGFSDSHQSVYTESGRIEFSAHDTYQPLLIWIAYLRPHGAKSGSVPIDSDLPAALDRCWAEARSALNITDTKG